MVSFITCRENVDECTVSAILYGFRDLLLTHLVCHRSQIHYKASILQFPFSDSTFKFCSKGWIVRIANVLKSAAGFYVMA